MKKQSKIQIAKTNLRLRMMAGIKGYDTVEISNIPKEWEKFLDSEDEWCGLHMPNSENSSACIYKAEKGSIFDPHDHKLEKEHMTIMNEGGRMKVLIEDYGTYMVDYPNAIAIPAGKVHAVIFETRTVIMIFWHPKFKRGWKAKFKEEVKPVDYGKF